jgi:hypothetical protein
MIRCSAEVAAASTNYAAAASGNVVVFQTVSQTAEGAQYMNLAGNATSNWALYEVPALMSNPSVTGITFNLIDESGSALCTVVRPK